MSVREEQLIKQLENLRKTLPQSELRLARQRVMTAVRSGARPRLSPWKAFILRPKKFMPIILAILLAVGISGGTVAAAQNDLPDEALYPVKLWSERALEVVTISESQKVELAERFAERRAEEIEALLARGPKKGTPREHFLKAVDRMTERLESAKERLESLAERDPERVLKIAPQLEARINALTEAVRRLEARVEDGEGAGRFRELKEKLDRAEDAVREVLEKAERQASPEGLEKSARGFLGVLENKAAAVTKKYERLLEGGASFSTEFTATIEQAATKKDEAKVALDAGEFRKAFVLAKESMRFYIELGLRLNLESVRERFSELRAPPAETRPEPESEDSEEEGARGSTEGAIEVAPILELRLPTTPGATIEVPVSSDAADEVEVEAETETRVEVESQVEAEGAVEVESAPALEPADEQSSVSPETSGSLGTWTSFDGPVEVRTIEELRQ